MRKANCIILIFCCVIVLYCYTSISLAQELPPDLASALGLQYLEPGPKISREEARNQLKELILSRLSELEGWPKDYAHLKNNKAIAIQYTAPNPNPFIPRWYRADNLKPHISYWGGGWGFETLEDARNVALQQCSECTYCGNEPCILFLENDSVIIPEQMIDDFINSKKLYIANEVSNLSNSERIVLFDRASSSISSSTQSEWSKVMRVPSNNTIIVGNPDCQQDYSDVCQDRVLFPLVRVQCSIKGDVLSRLQEIVSTGMYDEYIRTINTKQHYTQPKEGELWERMNRFTKKFEIDGDFARLKRLNFPKYLFDALKDKHVQTVWLEGSVRVTEDGLPLIPSENMAPLAVLTNEGLFLGVFVRLPDDGSRCYVSKPFANKIMDLSRCENKLSCARKALDTLQETLRTTFKEHPFESSLIKNEAYAPGEFSMKRIRKPSKLLGSPMYEISTYTFQTWCAEQDNPFYSLYFQQHFAGVNEKLAKDSSQLFLFLKVTHVVTTAVHRNGIYIEPDQNQISRIEGIVAKSVENVVKKTCYEMKGDMENDICKIQQISEEEIR